MGKEEMELRSRFDFSKAVRGRFHEQYKKGARVTLLEGDPALDDDPLAPAESDSQLIEIAGKHLLISHLLAAGFEVAEPLRDKGIDLIVYRGVKDFAALPIQMKASSMESFSLDGKYENVPKLLLAYVWNVQTPERNEVYALTFDEARKILEAKGYDKTASWKEKKYYFVRDAGTELKGLLKPYKMSAELWQRKLQSVA